VTTPSSKSPAQVLPSAKKEGTTSMTPTSATVNAHAVPAERRVLLRVEEAAKAMSIGRTTMYQLIASGEIETVTIGARRLVPLKAIERYVDSLMVAA
jgi:excisionase family DNA binding protein